MPTLNWIGKEAVINHDKDVPFRLLKKIKSVSTKDNSQNLIIHGDNLEALKALMPYYIGRIDCIYIDPPYNTGNEGWIYNDKVNSPKIKKWLGKVVKGEAEDLNRHDKWLCMIYPRLKLLRDLLSPKGAIFISIDETELSHLKLIADEIFSRENFITQITWRSKKQVSSDNKNFSSKVEYILVYSKTDQFIPKRLPLTDEYAAASFSNPNNDPNGVWQSVAITASKGHQGGGYQYMIKTPSGKKIERKWLYPEKSFKELLANNRIWFGAKGDSVPRRIMYLKEIEGKVPDNLWLEDGTNRDAKLEITELLGEPIFDTPKPVSLLKKIINIVCGPDSIILDSFAGSGTTGHAVLDLNKDDGGNRKFILIELEDNVAKDITAERVKRAIKKYDYGNGFEYCELSQPLFDEEGQIDEECDFKQLANYIYFTETQTNIDLKDIKDNKIGVHNGTEYYLLFREKGKNILNQFFLKSLKKDGITKIVYADQCMVDDDILEQYSIVFKQIPYEVRVY